MTKVFGIDVSKWQRGFDFRRAAGEGARFAVIRGAYSAPSVIGGGGVDTEFAGHYREANEAGLHVGLYQYSMAKTPDEAIAEARFLIENCLSGRKFALPVFIDVEDGTLEKAGKRTLTDTVKAWCSYMEKSGYFAGIYASKSFFDSRLFDAELVGYTHWVAQWASSCTYEPKSALGMWQFGGEKNFLRSTEVAGVVCDQSYMLTDYPARIAAAGLNGFAEAASVAAEFSGECAGTNIPRAKDSLVQYIGVASSGTNRYGYEAPVDKNGVVLAEPVYGIGNLAVPAGGRVLSGHGKAGEWLRRNVRAGYTLWVDDKVHVYPGVRRSLDGVNTKRGENALIMYRAPYAAADTNKYGYEVAVVGGVAVADPVYGKGRMKIPAGGFVLSGHGSAGKWLYSKIRKGRKVTTESDKILSVG